VGDKAQRPFSKVAAAGMTPGDSMSRRLVRKEAPATWERAEASPSKYGRH
jgi:hypothetical protein